MRAQFRFRRVERRGQMRGRHRIVETKIRMRRVHADKAHLIGRIDPDVACRFMGCAGPDIDRERAHHVARVPGIDMQSARLGPSRQHGIDCCVIAHHRILLQTQAPENPFTIGPFTLVHNFFVNTIDPKSLRRYIRLGPRSPNGALSF